MAVLDQELLKLCFPLTNSILFSPLILTNPILKITAGNGLQTLLYYFNYIIVSFLIFLKFFVQISSNSMLEIIGGYRFSTRGKFSNQSPPPFQKRKEQDIAVLFRFTPPQFPPPSHTPATQTPERNKDNPRTMRPFLPSY
ncbi:hypothetical protein CDAR_112481 [Caerostris darwini]|uniref:Uncharacterized protein n=1 Tax=Caerostris darwini TaxID=1538125 RepID=A0AAV4PYX4_9ARAC|nr:hypothetical protein CDAR_112481 [Caerostris darwini]